jgi:uncharacterized protein YjbI with pentapeptide repeats
VKYNGNNLEEVLAKHSEWLETLNKTHDYTAVGYADFNDADLSGHDFNDVNLSYAAFQNAKLRGASFVHAKLQHAYFDRAYLHGACFRDADLTCAHMEGVAACGADFSGTSFECAKFCRATLDGACFSLANGIKALFSFAQLHGANFSRADCTEAAFEYANCIGTNFHLTRLSNANLSHAKLYDHSRGITAGWAEGARLYHVDLYPDFMISGDLSKLGMYSPPPMNCPEEGAFIAWKKAMFVRHSIVDPRTDDWVKDLAGDAIVKLLIPEDAKRSSATSRKCRASKAVVLEIQDTEGNKVDGCAISGHDWNFIYRVGETVEPDSFNDNRWKECSNGIHFFLTRQEAVDYK